MLYTHNWALFFGAGSALSLVVLYHISGREIRENLIRDAIYAYVGAAILFAPWVPNFIFQSLHTAAPWNTSPRFGAPVQIAQSVYGGATVAAILRDRRGRRLCAACSPRRSGPAPRRRSP